MIAMKTMKNIAIKTLVNGLALWLAAIVVDGIEFGGGAEWTETLKTVVLVALVFAHNAVVKPILKFFATPLIWLTLAWACWSSTRSCCS